MNKKLYQLKQKIQSEYESARRLANDVWVDMDNKENDNEKWFFELGFISGLNYNSDGTLRQRDEETK